MGDPVKSLRWIVLATAFLLVGGSGPLRMGGGVASNAPPPPLCSVSGVICRYAFSLDRRVVSGAAKCLCGLRWDIAV